MTDLSAPHPTEAWEVWWRSSYEAGSEEAGGAKDPVLTAFWESLFNELLAAEGVRLLDLGCGTGVVTGFASACADAKALTLAATCLDPAPSALLQVKAKFPNVETLEAGAAEIPADDASFAIVVSQFGLEYAGAAAIAEAARVLAPGGTLGLVMHLREGAIDKESASTCSAINALLDTGIFEAFRRFAEESTELRKGQGSRVGFELADRGLSPKVKAVEAILQEHGKDVAGGMIFSTYADIAHMYQRIHSYEPEEVYYWLERASGELCAFRDRMLAMRDAGLDQAGIDAMTATLAAAGITLERCDQLFLGGRDTAAAWAVVARKAG